MQPLDCWDHGFQSCREHTRRFICVGFVVCCVGSGLCDEPITHSEEPYRLCVCSSNLSSEAALAQFRLMRHRKDKHDF